MTTSQWHFQFFQQSNTQTIKYNVSNGSAVYYINISKL